ncbi:MAG: adenylate/guanylate cyclase domain-containing protein [Rhodocyclaceae bacterium]|nr:adenylate/guanylate cyclase domain-containing protein [Rhodocyclaceae bacterium]
MVSRLIRHLMRHAWVLALAAAVLATGVAEGLYRIGATERLEHFYSDFWHRLADVRQEPAHAALVMIDDPTLNTRPDEPLTFWTRHFATALNTLKQAGAKVVVIDFIFSVSPERWMEKLGPMGREASRNFDQPFREQINRGNVVLASYRIGDGNSMDDFVLPSPDYLLALPDLDMTAHVGLANLRSDSDGAVRRFALAEAGGEFVDKEGLPRLAFGVLGAVRATGQDPRAKTFHFGGRNLDTTPARPIAYTGPHGTFKAVSFEKLLRPEALTLPEVQALAGKVVVIGTGYAGMNDVHPTPYSTSLGGAGALMQGPEIQANIIETLLAGRFVDETPTVIRLLVFMAVFGGLAFVGVRLSPWRAVVLVLLMVQVSALIAYALFKHDHLFPVAHLHLGMAVVLMCLALLRLTREERERARMGQMFGRYVSSHVVDALMASPELPELGGQARPITVLFSDIRNFTTISEKLTAREVVEMLNTYFERACAVLLKEGATIDKFIGDAIMAEFGAPLAQADHAARGLRAAIALRQVALEFRGWMQQRFGDRDLPEFEIGIGLHSGEAVVGNIGSSVRMEYTAIGDTVNIASRLEGKTKDTGCHILASHDTVSGFQEGVVTGALHSLTVKGRSQPVEAYEIVALR